MAATETKYLTVKDVSERIHLTGDVIRKHLNDGSLPGVRSGRKWLISEQDLAEWLQSPDQQLANAKRLFEAMVGLSTNELILALELIEGVKCLSDIQQAVETEEEVEQSGI